MNAINIVDSLLEQHFQVPANPQQDIQAIKNIVTKKGICHPGGYLNVKYLKSGDNNTSNTCIRICFSDLAVNRHRYNWDVNVFEPCTEALTELNGNAFTYKYRIVTGSEEKLKTTGFTIYVEYVPQMLA